jgi:hypothetical protein
MAADAIIPGVAGSVSSRGCETLDHAKANGTALMVHTERGW